MTYFSHLSVPSMNDILFCFFFTAINAFIINRINAIMKQTYFAIAHP